MQPPRVLYVEDDEDSREMLRMLLEMRSIETKAVGTAGEALLSIQGEHFDVYLLDAITNCFKWRLYNALLLPHAFI